MIAVFLLIVVALRKKVSVGVTLFGAGLLTALFYSVELSALLSGYGELLGSLRFLFLNAVVVQITFLGSLLSELRYLERLATACRLLWGGRRTACATLPPMIGLMPMPGGSLLSAPLVDKVLGVGRYRPEFRTVTNYWFRHIVEFFWPIYPGIILTEAITGLPIGSVSLMQFPMTLAMIVIGFVFFIRRIDNSDAGQADMKQAVIGIIGALWPIILAILLYGILQVELALAILLSTVALIARERPARQKLLKAVRKGLSYKLILLVFGTLSFQTSLELSGAIESIPRLSSEYNLPQELVIFLVCFTAGLLTGMVAAYVAMGYTILAGFLYQPQIAPSLILLAYISGYVGIMLSPTHLCLILTNDYFKSDLLRVYRQMALPIILLMLFGFLLYLSPWGELFRLPIG